MRAMSRDVPTSFIQRLIAAGSTEAEAEALDELKRIAVTEPKYLFMGLREILAKHGIRRGSDEMDGLVRDLYFYFEEPLRDDLEEANLTPVPF